MRAAAWMLASLVLATSAFARDPGDAPVSQGTGSGETDAHATKSTQPSGAAAGHDVDAAPPEPVDAHAAEGTEPIGSTATPPDETIPGHDVPLAEGAVAVDPSGAHGSADGAHDSADGAHGSADGAHGSADGAHGAEAHGESYLPKFVNFAIFAGFLFYVLNKPARAFFAARRAGIGSSLSQAEAARQEAQSKLVEMEARLAALDEQVKEILSKAGEQAAAEKELILQEARLAAKKILAQAESQVADLEAASARRLKAMAADLAVEAAREIVEKQIAPEDRSRFFDRTLKGLQKVSN